MEANTNPLGWSTWAWRCLLALMLVVAAYNVAGGLSNFARASGNLEDIGPIGATLEQPAGTPAGWSEVTGFIAVGPAAGAGIEEGDLVRFDRPLGYALQYRAGISHPLTIDRDGTRFHMTIVAEPTMPLSPWLFALSGLGSLVTTAFGAILLIRGRGNRAAAMLGMILLALGMAATRPYPWAPGIAVGQVLALVELLDFAIAGYFWPLFSLAVSGGASSRRQARLVHGSAVVFAAVFLALEIALMIPLPIPFFGPAILFVPIIASQIFGYAIIAGNYPRNDPPTRNRIKIVVVAFVCYLLAQVLMQAQSFLLGTGTPPMQLFWMQACLTVLSFIGLALLAYAVLKQKLFDLNFALNRTLVYATVSFVLLAAFGLAKWVIEHLIPDSWHAGSEYYSVGIALLLFLALHRVHNWVERNVERVFFSPWHRNEEELRRFVTAAGHFDETAALCRAFAKEVTRFAQGAGAALYLRGTDSSYVLGCGALAEALPEVASDDLALALMRAERRPVKAAETQTALPGVLALPMLDHGKLMGFLLLDRKGDGTDYRPDEVEVLGWAAHQVGLDLQAMRAGELEAEVTGLNSRLTAITEERDRLGALLTGSTVLQVGKPKAPSPKGRAATAAGSPDS